MTKLKVLVPVDFSETSRRALAWAFDYALRAPCEIHVLHVSELHFDEIGGASQERITNDLWAVDQETRVEMDNIVPKDERGAVGSLYRHVGYGKPASVIIRLASDLGPDLIVMGTHGRTGLAHLIFGSVAEQVLRRAPCPVVCVKPILGAAPAVSARPATPGENSARKPVAKPT